MPLSRLRLSWGVIMCVLLFGCTQKDGESKKLNFPFFKKDKPDTYLEEDTASGSAEGINEGEENGENLEPESFVDEAFLIYDLLKNYNIPELVKYIHPDMDLIYSPYGFIREPVKFSALDLINASISDSVYLWGFYDGSGDSILMTFPEYHKDFVFCNEFSRHIDTAINRPGNPSNSLDNFLEIFPEGGYVDFYVKGTEEYGFLDWRSLRLGFVKKGRKWYLVAIIHDEWTT